MSEDYILRDATTLRKLYGAPHDAAIAKQADYLHSLYQEFIRAPPFVVLATAGQDGLDTSPRGDAPGFVAIEDERTLLLPDRRGNNRIDCLINITSDPRVSLIFLIPGVNETIRVTGTAEIAGAILLLAPRTGFLGGLVLGLAMALGAAISPLVIGASPVPGSVLAVLRGIDAERPRPVGGVLAVSAAAR